MIVKLIMPKRKNAVQEEEKMDGNFYSTMTGHKRVGGVMSSLPVLAGVTPRTVRLILEDENIETIDYDVPVDLVGISTNTAVSERAYEIADVYRKKNVPVVLGGPHVSVLPDEALQHADAVVIGEGESLWPQIIRDVQKERLQQRYVAKQRPLMARQKVERYDLLRNDKYLFHNYQTARGCPFDCYFCSIQTHLGKKYRPKKVSRVVSDVKKLKRLGDKLIFFCDDNFVVDRTRTIKLLKKLVPLNIRYAIQARVDIYTDHELLDLLAQSGCVNILIGFESVNAESLRKMHKPYNQELYLKAIHEIQARGLFITGSFIFGFDEDTKDIFEKTVAFISQSGMGSCTLNVLTPLPGTPFYEEFKTANRLLHQEWTLYDCRHVCFKPKNMTSEELYQGYMWAFQTLFDMDTLYERVMRVYSLWNTFPRIVYSYRQYPLLTNFAQHSVAYSFPLVKEAPR